MPPYKSDQQRRFFHYALEHKKPGFTKSMVHEWDEASKGKKMPKFAKMRHAMAAGGEVEDPADMAPKTPDPAVPVTAPEKAPVAAKASGAGSGSGNSPTKTNTETGGSSPGGASTGGVGSGIGGAGTGGAATGGASTGGAGTVTVTISGSSSTDTSTETSSGSSSKKGKGKDKDKGNKPAGPITLNISNVGGKTDAGSTTSGDGPGAGGTGGRGSGSGGGGGGASPDEPENYSTSHKDTPSKFGKTMGALKGRR